MKEKLFTKSAFKEAIRCPAGLYYYRDPETYANQQLGDEFLQALAEGGFQVGEIAKIYRHVDEGCDLSQYKGYEDPLRETDKLMERENVVMAEAAFRYENLFVRADIIEKIGREIHLIEVKAKSWDGLDVGLVCVKKGKKKTDPCRTVLRDGFGTYLYDVAFQKYVIQNALDKKYGVGIYKVSASLMMADKSKVADVDGINQKFKIIRDKSMGRSHIECLPGAKDLVNYTPVVTPVNVDDECAHIYAADLDDKDRYLHGMGFEEFVHKMCKAYCEHERLDCELSNMCFGCPYYATEKDVGKKDGFNECWIDKAGLSEEEMRQPLVDEMNGIGKNRGQLLQIGRYKLADIAEADLQPTTVRSQDKSGLQAYERQWLHAAISTGRTESLGVLRENVGSNGAYLDVDGLRTEMAKWKFPLHMIDFETSAVALPFYKGMRPYETVAFQFSHHVIDSKDGGQTYTISHEGQYINTEKGKFPNFEFIRELKRQLEKDGGSIFRYCSHENTVLRHIALQLAESSEPDKESLIDFIRLITHEKIKGSKKYAYKGERDMIDLWAIVKRFYWHPIMKGSNSIKAVLPAVLNSSKIVQKKYSQAIYGSEIKSLNISKESPISWIQWGENADGEHEIVNPYKHLPSISAYFPESARAQVEEACDGDDAEDGEETVNNGGAALWAYGMMQFGETAEREALTKALLRYCELDTLAMVFIWEYFNEMIRV